MQWVQAVKGWVEEINPQVWEGARTHAATAGLDADMTAAFRISEWIDLGGANGHWKGDGSGSNADFIGAAKWVILPDSPLVDLFKVARVQERITPGLYTDADVDPASVPPVRRAAVGRSVVIVRTEEAHAKDDVGILEPNIDPAGKPDFFAEVTIAGTTYVEAMQLDRDSITPAWASARFLPTGTAQAAIQYRLIDEDGGTNGEDDVCDINPATGQKDLDLSFNLAGGPQAVASEGKKPDPDRAGVKLRLSSDALAPLPTLTISAAVGTNGTNAKADVAIVQELLNAIPADQGGPAAPLKVDGLIGPKTIAAIKKFQSKQLGFEDGRVDPGQATLKRLNEF